MTSQKLWCSGLFIIGLSSFSRIASADPAPTVAKTMEIAPTQKDVEYETPKQSEYAKCRVEIEKKGKTIGWAVYGPQGQTLRKFLDTDADGKYDQYRYYNLGIEVYRDIDTNQNQKIDQCRWLNRGGSRWGIDRNEDGHIDQWKVLSAAEASREAIRAMISGDPIALQAVMVTADDLKSLGVNPQLATKLLESASDADKKARTVMKGSKIMTPHSVWSRFDAQLPSIIPIDDEKARDDLVIYESAYAIIESTKKDGTKDTDAVQIGEMIRVGEVWKLTQVPTPIEGKIMTTTPILMEPLLASASGDAAGAAPSPKLEKMMKEVQEIEHKVMQPNVPVAQVKTGMAKRNALLRDMIDESTTEAEKVLLSKQLVDGIAVAAQWGTYPEGVKELKTIEADVAKKSAKSPLLPYTVYRRVQSEYAVVTQAIDTKDEKVTDDKDDKNNEKKGNPGGAKNKKQEDAQEAWLKSLESFVATFPDAEDADDALMNLGMTEELQGHTKEATAWYQRLIDQKPKSEAAARAQGAIRRLNLNGQTLALEGPLLTGGNLDIKKQLKGQVVLVVFWHSAYSNCENDVPQLRALYKEYKPKGLEIVGVALEPEKLGIQAFLKRNEMSWPQIFQPTSPNAPSGSSSPIATSFGIISYPTMFLVDKDGKVVSRNANITEVKNELPELLNLKKK